MLFQAAMEEGSVDLFAIARPACGRGVLPGAWHHLAVWLRMGPTCWTTGEGCAMSQFYLIHNNVEQQLRQLAVA